MFDAVTGEKTEFVELSSLFINAMVYREDAAEVPVDSRLSNKVKIIVVIGGDPVSEEFDRRAGADDCGADGSQAIAVAGSLSTA